MYFYFSYFNIFCPYEFLELIEILFCSILNRIGPDMSRYYTNSVFRQTSRGLVSTLDFVKTRKYFYCSYFYILCPYEFIELNEILFRSILNRIDPILQELSFSTNLKEVSQYIGFCKNWNVFLLFIFLHFLSRIGPDMCRYYRNSVFRQTSKGQLVHRILEKLECIFIVHIFYIFCPYEFLELIEILFCSILNRIGLDMSRYYRNSVFRQTSRGLVSTLDFVENYFYI